MMDKTQKVQKSDAEWRAELTPEQYRVLREKGTERPFTGQYVHEKTPGVYTCAACGQPLFKSDTKFDSGSGWPSFWDVIEQGNVELKSDRSLFMVRTEVVCGRCGSHLGHVFEDGPQDTTGLRYCINSASLDLVPDADTD
jgi:peptide-methionine (R)-S-oxide reductase